MEIAFRASTDLESLRFEYQRPVSLRRDLLSEDRRHWGTKRNTELNLIEAYKSSVRVHETVVVHHGEHECSSESVTIQKGDGRHWISAVCSATTSPLRIARNNAHEKSAPYCVQTVGNEPGRPVCVIQVEAIRVEFLDARCGDDNSRRVSQFDNVKG